MFSSSSLRSAINSRSPLVHYPHFRSLMSVGKKRKFQTSSYSVAFLKMLKSFIFSVQFEDDHFHFCRHASWDTNLR